MVFLGLLFAREDEAIIAANSRGGQVQNQVNAFQWNCLDGLVDNGVDVHIVSALPVGTFPRHYNKLILPSTTWSYYGREHRQLGTWNLPFLKQWIRQRRCRKQLRCQADKEIVIYSAYQPFLKAIKRLDPSYKITLIVPDLPTYYDYGQVGGFKRWLRKRNNRSIEKCLARVDRFVLFTEAMKEPLGVGDRPYTVVEGICSSTDAPVRAKDTAHKTILYAGALHRRFGIDTLLQAFSMLRGEEYRLCLCGGGDYEDEIRRAAEKDARIDFKGFVSKDTVTRLQAEATLLVNPRQNTEDYTKYSFPSKTMDYLLSGVPVAAYKLSGIPDEYDAYLHYPSDNSAEALCALMRTICEDAQGSYERRAAEAVMFLQTEKSPKCQAKKMVDLMKY